MKAVDLREKTIKELKQEILNLRKEQFNLRMQRGSGQLANTAQFNLLRKDIARIKTILNEKASGQSNMTAE